MSDIMRADAAICRFRVRNLFPAERSALAWGPLPCRDTKGSICFGLNFEGWAWRAEVLAAIAGWPGLVEIIDAWCWRSGCEHKPFAYVPEVYRQRLAWGKEGAGLTLKLGLNAGYGRTAQRVGGGGRYTDWCWAGLTTSTTRAQLLDGIASARDKWDVLAVATDGLYSTQPLPLALPRDTGTSDLPKPLGGWEVKDVPQGAFFAKPGMYWQQRPETNDVMRARGIGRREAFAQYAAIEAAFAAWDRADFDFGVQVQSRRFYGLKQSIRYMAGHTPCGTHWAGMADCPMCPKCGQMGDYAEPLYTKLPSGQEAIGRWSERTIQIGFDPRPKREGCLPGGEAIARLRLRDLGGAVSVPYVSGGPLSPEAAVAREGKDRACEQPDWTELSPFELEANPLTGFDDRTKVDL